jgi:hypothetical protein
MAQTGILPGFTNRTYIRFRAILRFDRAVNRFEIITIYIIAVQQTSISGTTFSGKKCLSGTTFSGKKCLSGTIFHAI